MERFIDAVDLSIPGRIHLIGACGSGMRSLDRVLRREGWHVTGSDSAPADAAMGVHCGHSPAHVPEDVDLVVASDAVPADNCERRRAEQLGVPLLSYAQMLGRLSADRHTLAVAGTHGKSTTAAMVDHILRSAGRPVTAIYGAEALDVPAVNADHGSHDQIQPLLIEACEYRNNFLNLRPDISVITGIEPDHFDCFPTQQSVEQAFFQFTQNTKPSGLVLVGSDGSAGSVPDRFLARMAVEHRTFGLSSTCDWQATHIAAQRGHYSAVFWFRERRVGSVQLRVPGQHNLRNALAAAALAGSFGIADQAISAGLNDFAGVRRRLEYRGSCHGVLLYDDYAHHPTEVRASLTALRETVPNRRIWCVFQPHQASRTARLLEDFAQALQIADNVLVASIFRAREGSARSSGIRSADLARRVEDLGGAVDRRFTTDSASSEHNLLAEEIFQAISHGELTSGDVVVTMGAGDIEKVIDGISQRIRENRAAG